MAYPPISSLPNPPSRQDPANFAAESDAFLAALPTFRTETNAAGTYLEGVGTAVDADVVAAEAAKVAAQQARDQAVAATNATAWVSGASYTAGQVVWSLLNYQTYRAKVNHSGITDDPSVDATNWDLLTVGNAVQKTSDTGSAVLPKGTTAQRDVSPEAGYLRFNTEDGQFEGYNGTEWGAIGGGGNTVDFVATGTFSNGKPVVVRSDGTVEVVQEVVVVNDPPLAGTPVVFEIGTTSWISTVYDPNTQKVVVAYMDASNSNFGTAIVGTVSGTSISFGTAVVFNSAQSTSISTTYDPNTQKVVIAYRDAGNAFHGRAIVGTVSGTSISFGTPVTFESASTNEISSTYDSVNQKVVIAYQDGANSGFGTAVVGTVSGTSISFGTPVVFESAGTNYTSSTYDSVNQKIVIAYQDSANSSFGTAIVGTVSGTSVSFGTPVVFESASTSYISSTYDPNTQRVVIAYQDGGNSFFGTAIVGTVSGTSISFGAPVVFGSAATDYISTTYDPNTQKAVIAYRDLSFGTAIVGTVSGTSISFGTPTVFESASTIYISSTYDSVNQKVVIAYRDGGNSNFGTSAILDTGGFSTNATNESFIGFSDGSYTNGQTAKVQIVGAVTEAQTGLTAGQAYYVQNDGTLSTTPDTPSIFAGTAIASTKLIVKG